VDYKYIIDKKACRESFEKFQPEKQRLIKKMAVELEKIIEVKPAKIVPKSGC